MDTPDPQLQLKIVEQSELCRVRTCACKYTRDFVTLVTLKAPKLHVDIVTYMQ